MWAPGILVAIAALAGALLLMLYSGLFVIGIPLFIVAVVAIGVLDHARRQRHVDDVREFREQAKAEPVEFTERDRQTLVGE